MKKLLHFSKVAFSIVLSLFVSFNAFAHDFKVDGIYFRTLNKSAKTVTVTYQGYSHDSYTNEYSGSVIIPSSVTYSGTT